MTDQEDALERLDRIAEVGEQIAESAASIQVEAEQLRKDVDNLSETQDVQDLRLDDLEA